MYLYFYNHRHTDTVCLSVFAWHCKDMDFMTSENSRLWIIYCFSEVSKIMHVFNRDGQFGQFIFSAVLRDSKMRVYPNYFYPLSTYTSNTNASDEHLFTPFYRFSTRHEYWLVWIKFQSKKTMYLNNTIIILRDRLLSLWCTRLLMPNLIASWKKKRSRTNPPVCETPQWICDVHILGDTGR